LGWGKTTGDPGDGNPPERGPGAEPHAVDGCLQWGRILKVGLVTSKFYAFW